MSDPVIELDGAGKRYPGGTLRRRGGTQAVYPLDLTIDGGQVYGFLGRNGAGKTTTIRMMLDLVHPTSGQVRLFGREVRRHPEVVRRAGALVEGAAFYPFLSAPDNLAVLGRTFGHHDPHRVRALLAQVGLTDAGGRPFRAFSTGMKQRLGVAAALLSDPELVILDEPTNGLDPAGIQQMRHFIRSLVDERGKTVFLSSHLLSEVEQICDRVAIIHHGQLVTEGGVGDLLADRIWIRVEAEPLAEAHALLAARWRVSLTGESLRVEAGREAVADVARLVVESGLRLHHLAVERQRLEELFLDLTGEGTDDRQPAAG